MHVSAESVIWPGITRVLLFLLPIGVLLGPYAAIGPATLFRVVVVALVVCAVVVGRSWRHELWLIALGLLWLVVGLVSGMVGPYSPGWAELANLMVGFALAWSLARLRIIGPRTEGCVAAPRRAAQNPSAQTTLVPKLAAPKRLVPNLVALNWLALGWEAAVLISAPVAVWERLTTRHLSGFIDGQWRGRPLVYPFPGTFFVNPNYYALFLAVGVAVLCYRAVRTRGWARAGHATICLVAAALVVLTESLACVIALGCMLAAALLVVRRGIWVVLAMCVVGALAVATTMSSLAVRLADMWQQVWAGHDQGSSSFPVRMALLSFGIHLVVANPWLGVGPGGFAKAAAHADPALFHLHHKINPHNGILQVATEYGLPLAGCLLMVWAWIGVRSWRRRREDPALAGLALALVLSAPPLSIANSLYIGPNVVALWMGLLVLVAAMADTLSRRGSGPVLDISSGRSGVPLPDRLSPGPFDRGGPESWRGTAKCESSASSAPDRSS